MARSPVRSLILPALIVAIPLATVTAILRPQLVAVYLYFAAHQGTCSLVESYQSANETIRQNTRAADLVARSSGSPPNPDGTELWTTPDGLWWAPAKSGNAVLYDLAEQDRDIYRTGSDGIQPGDVVLDCGANVGVFTRKALSKGASRVIAIEPAPENLVCLRKNLAAEIATGRVTIYEKGVWDKDDVLTMHIDPNNSAADSFVRNRPDANDIKLPLTTVDRLVGELGLARVDFIKMDIEGAERHAISGASATIRRFHPRMALCVYHLSDDPAVIPAAVFSIESRYQIASGCLRLRDAIFPQVAHFRPN